MKRLYIVRHCSATGQAADAPLTNDGREQANLLSDFLARQKIDAILSSPFVRAIQSIEPFAKRANLHVQLDERLAERVLSSEPMDNWLDCLQQTFSDFELAFDGGESSGQAMNRAVAALGDVSALNQGSTVVVTHGNLMTLLLRHFDERFGFETWAALTNPDVYLVAMNGSESTVKRVWGHSEGR
jgi:2,3-bisphosphoglycerate-dependent phosphoglycerate mutase